MCDEDTKDKADEDSSSLLELDLTISEQHRLVVLFIHKNYSPLSIRVFEDMIDDGHDFKDALFQSALNEMINVALAECMTEDLLSDDKNEEKEADTQD